MPKPAPHHILLAPPSCPALPRPADTRPITAMNATSENRSSTFADSASWYDKVYSRCFFIEIYEPWFIADFAVGLVLLAISSVSCAQTSVRASHFHLWCYQSLLQYLQLRVPLFLNAYVLDKSKAGGDEAQYLF